MSWVSDAAIDKPLHEVAASNDPAVQKELYGQVQELVAKGAYHLGLYPQTTRLVIKKRLQGVWIEPSEGEPVLHDAWLAK
jgi:peptide/nickel transport system substrate-binding protein